MLEREREIWKRGKEKGKEGGERRNNQEKKKGKGK